MNDNNISQDYWGFWSLALSDMLRNTNEYQTMDKVQKPSNPECYVHHLQNPLGSTIRIFSNGPN
jgi:hypothetical protein